MQTSNKLYRQFISAKLGKLSNARLRALHKAAIVLEQKNGLKRISKCIPLEPRKGPKRTLTKNQKIAFEGFRNAKEDAIQAGVKSFSYNGNTYIRKGTTHIFQKKVYAVDKRAKLRKQRQAKKAAKKPVKKKKIAPKKKRGRPKKSKMLTQAEKELIFN